MVTLYRKPMSHTDKMSSFKIFVSGGNNLPSGLLDIINQNKGKPIAISQPSAAASAGPNGASVAEPTSSAMVFSKLKQHIYNNHSEGLTNLSIIVGFFITSLFQIKAE